MTAGRWATRQAPGRVVAAGGARAGGGRRGTGDGRLGTRRGRLGAVERKPREAAPLRPGVREALRLWLCGGG